MACNTSNISDTTNCNDSIESCIVCMMQSDGKVECNGIEYGLETGKYKATAYQFWLYLGLYILMILSAGLMSGLTMGLLSLDILSLEVLKRGGKPREKKFASRILIIVKRHHLLLVTLLLANALAVEAMPIFLSKITSEVIAVIVSVTAVLLFGEIIPQALCTRYGLAIGYYCSPIVLVLMGVLFPIAFPIAIVLDCMLGSGHGTFFRRAELRELVKIHGSVTHNNEDPLSYDEVLIVKGALEMRDKTVIDAMTPLESVYMMDINRKIDGDTMKELLEKGHSRVPVYQDRRDNVCGILLVKKLIELDPDDCTPVVSIEGAHSPPPSCLTTMPLFKLLNHFQTGRSHLSLVYEEKSEDSEPVLKGIITLEDVIEELIGEEIVDETDQYVDVHRRIAVARARFTYHRQCVSEPVKSATAATPRAKQHRRWKFQRSHSQPQSSFADSDNEQKPPTPSKAGNEGGGATLEAIYEAADLPKDHYVYNTSTEDTTDEREDAPLIMNIN